MKGYAERRNPRAPDLAELYLEIAGRYGVRGDVAFCQAMYDTRTWTCPPRSPPWTPFARTIWGEAVRDWPQDRQENHIELHIQYLYAFASPRGSERELRLPAFLLNGNTKEHWHGSAACWQDLNGKWLVPGVRYGQDVIAIWRNMMEWTGEGMPEMNFNDDSKETLPIDAHDDDQVEGSRPVTEPMNWLRSQGLLPSPAPHPDRKVSWHELASLLRLWEESQSK
jgi:hypothetical protein